MDRRKKSTYRAALQLRHFAALLSAETFRNTARKAFPFTTPQSQPSDCKRAAHHGAHKGSLQRYNARQADLSSGMCLWRLARELKGKTWEQRQPSFSGSPDLYVGHIAGQAYALVSEKLQRLDQSVGGP